MATKSGGNANVHIDDGIATKILRNPSKRTIARFKVEVEVLVELLGGEYPRVVTIVDYDLDAAPPWLSMPAFDGDARSILDETRGNPVKTAALLLPVIRDLRALATRAKPIYHRDLKPENLLVRRTEEGTSLYVADFGCAFLRTDSRGRMTPPTGAVGARAFLAPEYQHGRVDDVTEKGDVFSLGKLLWHFVNGKGKEVFPYTLWHPAQYDITVRHPDAPGISRLALIIAQCCHHDPNARMTYNALVESLVQIGARQADAEVGVDLMRFEAREALREESVLAVTKKLLDLWRQDFKGAHQALTEESPTSLIVREMFTIRPSIRRTSTESAVIAVKQASDVPLWVHQRPGLSVHARLYPPGFAAKVGITSEYPLIEFRVSVRGTTRLCRLAQTPSGTVEQVDGSLATYQGSMVLRVMRHALAELTQN